MEKTICLIAGRERFGTIQDYVLYIARKLSKTSDVCYFADGKLSTRELNKIGIYTKYAAACAHYTSDFGSWQCLVEHLGFDELTSYDKMIICNDSIYGPVGNIEDIFDYMDLNDYDFWGLTEKYNTTYHHDGYFMVFKNDVIVHPKFQQFWREINPMGTKKTYASVLSPFLTELGFYGTTYIKNYKKGDALNYPLHLFDFNRQLSSNRYVSQGSFARETKENRAFEKNLF